LEQQCAFLRFARLLLTLATDSRYLQAAEDLFFIPNGYQRCAHIQKQKKSGRLFFEGLKSSTVIGIEYKNTICKSLFFDWNECFFWGAERRFNRAWTGFRSQKHHSRDLCRSKSIFSSADAAMKRSLPSLRSGITEKEFAWILEKAGRERGAEKISFAPIVAYGEHSAIPHHSPTEKELEKKMPILIDWGLYRRWVLQ
jgi:Xaa-Pro aminopeptidase